MFLFLDLIRFILKPSIPILLIFVPYKHTKHKQNKMSHNRTTYKRKGVTKDPDIFEAKRPNNETEDDESENSSTHLIKNSVTTIHTQTHSSDSSSAHKLSKTSRDSSLNSLKISSSTESSHPHKNGHKKSANTEPTIPTPSRQKINLDRHTRKSVSSISSCDQSRNSRKLSKSCEREPVPATLSWAITSSTNVSDSEQPPRLNSEKLSDPEPDQKLDPSPDPQSEDEVVGSANKRICSETTPSIRSVTRSLSNLEYTSKTKEQDASPQSKKPCVKTSPVKNDDTSSPSNMETDANNSQTEGSPRTQIVRRKKRLGKSDGSTSTIKSAAQTEVLQPKRDPNDTFPTCSTTKKPQKRTKTETDMMNAYDGVNSPDEFDQEIEHTKPRKRQTKNRPSARRSARRSQPRDGSDFFVDKKYVCRILIPQIISGKILGSKGKDIQSYREKFRCKVAVPDNNLNCNERMCRIMDENIENVIDCAKQIISDISKDIRKYEDMPDIDNETDVRLVINDHRMKRIVGEKNIGIKEFRSKFTGLSLIIDHRNL